MDTNTPVDYKRISIQLIRRLRGKRSQPAFSKRLGYRCNAVYTWESGRRWPSAKVFFQASKLSGRNPKVCLEEFFKVQPAWLRQWDIQSPDAVAVFLRELRGSSSIGDIAVRMGNNRFAVSRWLKGRVDPRLPELLHYIEATSMRLLDFISVFVDPSSLPSAAEAWERLQASRQSAYEMPWSHAVLRALELDDYRALAVHQSGWIARRLGISAEQETQCLDVLARSGQIVISDKRWKPTYVLAVDTRHNEKANRKMKQWWAQVATQKLATNAPGLFSYNLFTVSTADLERIEALHVAYFNSLRDIVAQSQSSDHIVLANMQLFRLDEPSLL